jgi:DNA uptake protein ComE-like DNA-binding protein
MRSACERSAGTLPTWTFINSPHRPGPPDNPGDNFLAGWNPMITRRTMMISLAATVLAMGLPAFAEAAAPAAPQAPPRLNPNTATAGELAAVPGITPALTAAIQMQRPFKSIVEFNTLVRQTLSEDQAKALYERLFIPVNLNTATREQISLIPGMTARMVGEFLEYRPYASIDVFNREIGKYVNAAEVARLRSYVTL